MQLRLFLVIFTCNALALFVRAGEAKRYGPGTRLEKLAVGATVYHDINVRTVTARTVLFMHRDGMASVKLSELDPELRDKFGYDPVAEAESDAAMRKAIKEREAIAAAAKRDASSARRFDAVLQQFGTTATPMTGVDLRPRFRGLELYAKDQGRRPSCSVFAVVSALEFINAGNTGRAEKFSEEYLIWATSRTIQRSGTARENRSRAGDDADTGFSLAEVVTALRGYGIPPQDAMPNTIGHATNATAEPSAAVIAEARQHGSVSIHLVSGRDNPTRLNNVVHALNAGIPVVIGTVWPRFQNMRAALLNSQTPVYNHAITLVGYRCPSGRLEDATFIFKNSWGVAWGAGGYGFATYAYLARHLQAAVLLELAQD
ncbi:MAG: C1 family peptidase [Opitutaceae bacterium]|nr:C1 family peptidase [Opitutaceae bacterium]